MGSHGEPVGSDPDIGGRVIVSANFLNESRLRTVLIVPVTANLTREHYRGNVRLPATKTTGKPSVDVTTTEQTYRDDGGCLTI